MQWPSPAERVASVRAGAQPSALGMLVRRHPVAAFMALTLGWSWSIWTLLFLWGGQAVLMQGPPPSAFVVAVLGACGPTLAGLVLTCWIDGRTGLRALRERLRPAGLARWWPALLIIPGVSALTPLLRSLAGHPQDGPLMLALLLPGLALGLAAGLMEEFGWRGFLLPRLLQRHSPLGASLFTGLLWGGLWHGYADYFGVAGEGWRFWLVMLLLGPGVLTAWSLVLTCVHRRTGGNLLVSILMHAGISSSALVFGQHYGSQSEELAWTAVSVGLALAAAVLVWTISGASATGRARTAPPSSR